GNPPSNNPLIASAPSFAAQQTAHRKLGQHLLNREATLFGALAARTKQIFEITGVSEPGWQYHLGIAPGIGGNQRYRLDAMQLRREARDDHDQPFVLITACKGNDLLSALALDLQREIIALGKQLGICFTGGQGACDQMLLDTPVAPVLKQLGRTLL